MDTVSPTFGPVPSRRLGRSLGINNVPPKTCSYSCIYCQLGWTPTTGVERRTFHRPEEVMDAVRAQVREALRRGEEVDHLTFVPDGEPTLDLNLGAEIRALKELGVPIAVITNASLVGRDDVREDLSAANWVSLKVDAVSEAVWRRINRPHRDLSLTSILAGIRKFSRTFGGILVTETMLASGVNDHAEELHRIADFLGEVRPRVAYLAVPTRPPAEPGVEPPPGERLVAAFSILSAQLSHVELLIGYEGDAFAASGDARRDLLSIVAVHPMREGAVRKLLARDGAGGEVVEELVATGTIVEIEYRGHRFYVRALPGRRQRTEERGDATG